MANREAGFMQQAAEHDPRIRWLKPLVIGLSIVFFGGLVLLAVLIATGTHRGSRPAPPPAAVQDFGITLPKNSRIAEVLATGNRIVLRVRLADGTERLYALDGESLRPLGSVTIQAER